jgi:hypothetical protein
MNPQEQPQPQVPATLPPSGGSTLKKLAIGCLGVIALLAVGGGVAAFYIYRKVSSTVSGFAELASIPDLDKEIRNTSAFKPPASGELTPDMVSRLVGVQDKVRLRLGADVNRFETEYRELMNRETNQMRAKDFSELFGAYRDFARLVVAAKRAQVEAINEARFSKAEYHWIRGRVYEALGVPLLYYDMSQTIEELKKGHTPPEPMAEKPETETVPQRNREVIEPYREKLQNFAHLAAVGL